MEGLSCTGEGEGGEGLSCTGEGEGREDLSCQELKHPYPGGPPAPDPPSMTILGMRRQWPSLNLT